MILGGYFTFSFLARLPWLGLVFPFLFPVSLAWRVGTGREFHRDRPGAAPAPAPEDPRSRRPAADALAAGRGRLAWREAVSARTRSSSRRSTSTWATANLDPVAQPMPSARAAADQGVRPRLEVVVVVGQAGDVDQALDRQLDEPAEEAEVLDADDDGVERLADLLLQVGQQLDPDQLALGGLGPALGPGAVLAQDDQLVEVALAASCPPGSR